MPGVETNTEWHSDSEFWKEFYHFIFDQNKEENAPGEVARIVALSGIHSGNVLDMPCGGGRHAVEFSARGFTVTAVDINSDLLGRARQRAAEAGCTVEFVQNDMRQFIRDNFYELAINMFTSLGYYCDTGEDLRVVRNIASSLRSGGQAVFEMAGREVVRENFQPLLVEHSSSGLQCTKNLKPSADWRIMRNEWELKLPDGKKLQTAFEQLIYSKEELEQLLGQAGFSGIRFYGSLDGNAYCKDASRLVAVAEK